MAKEVLPSTSNHCHHGPANQAERPKDDSPTASMEVKEELSDPWTLFMDGSSCIYGFEARIILTSTEGIEFTYALRFEFDATNNEAEYEALIAGKTLANNFKKFSIKQVPRNENKKADALSEIASTSFAHLTKQVLVEVLKEKSINEAEVLTVANKEGNTWMTPIYEYLTKETLHAERKKARVVRLKSRRMHAGPRSVVAKAIRTGYYWPTMRKDARKVIREYQDCQVYRPMPRNLQHKLAPITSLWPFYKWVIDIAGPFPEGPGKHFASVKHPQTNGLVERASRSLGEGIKVRLDKKKQGLDGRSPARPMGASYQSQALRILRSH
uniref:Integrase zinc-binding domain-containing protein n=1 Tax=Tanacetum cinerariifolium TaxID=118510 RepID=A0A6L2MK04_TANCI|nr:hypothetical protein [Tanacetum cinerariifolium]